jgi:hypothetical protein
MTAATQLRWLLSGNPRVSMANRRRAPGVPVRLLPRPIARGPLAHSPRRINALLAGRAPLGRYLEIGIFEGATLQMVSSPSKVGVDPEPRFDLAHLPDGISVHPVASDEFFAALDPASSFDLAFLDGLHHFEQTYRDLVNALAHVPDGPILIDDTVPSSARSAMREREEAERLAAADGESLGPWHGDAWKVVLAIARLHPELEFRTILGSGNPQTLVWRRARGTVVSPASADLLEAMGRLRFEEVLGSELPQEFRPADEATAIDVCRSAILG